MYSVLPFTVFLVIGYVMKKMGRIQKISGFYPVRYQAITLPLVYSITASCFVVFGAFHFQQESKRSASCILMSGHWYTYVMTTLMSSLALVHVATAKGAKFVNTVLYFGYWFLYQALAILVLTRTQKFFHDDKEALSGIAYAMRVSPFALLVVITVEHYNQKKFATFQESNKKEEQAATANFTEEAKKNDDSNESQAKRPFGS